MKADRYRSFAELAEHEREGIDYQIRSHRRASPVAILAPHGGKIQEHTAEIGEAIAGEHFSFYAFEGIKRGRNQELFLKNMDEPECKAVTADAAIAVFIEGSADLKAEYVVIEGGDAAMRKRVAEALTDAEFEVREGSERTDMVLSLDLSRALRERLKDGTPDLDEFAGAVRNALLGYTAKSVPL